MRSLVALPLLALFAPAPAEASGCFLGPYAVTRNPALGCEVVVLSHRGSGPTQFSLTTMRDGEPVDVTGTITTTSRDVDVQYTNYACDGSVIVDYTATEPYDEYRLAISGAQVGEILTVNGVGEVGTVMASGACTEDTSLVVPACSGLNSGYPCDDEAGGGANSDDDVGCSAGGSSGLGGLLLLALVGRRHRRR